MPDWENPLDYPFLNTLGYEDFVAILPHTSEHEYPDGTLILAPSEASSNLHIILSGQVHVSDADQTDVTLAKLGRGRFFDAWSCFTGEPVRTDFRADGPVTTLSISRTGMRRLMDSSPDFRDQVFQSMMKQVSPVPDQPVSGSPSPAGLRLDEARELRLGPLVGKSAFIQSMKAQIPVLAAGDQPLVLTGEAGVGKFHIASKIHDASSRSLGRLLSMSANSYDPLAWETIVRAAEGGTIILEQADLFPAALLHRLVRSAERSRVIMTGETRPDIPAHHVPIIPLRERSEDIPDLVYDFLRNYGLADPAASITEEALRLVTIFPYQGDNIDGLHRVVQGALARSEGKLVRGLHLRFERVRKPGTRPTVGLALGSGSVRGAAHVGVMKVFEDEQIPIDLITGSSVGSFIGALYAGGQPISAFERVLPTVRWGQLVELTMPPKAFVHNRRMIRFVESYIGPVDFRDLRIPFAAVAADAATGEAYILNSGRVSEAICASTAIPGVMQPVQYRDRLLIDGGVVHPVPVLLAKAMGADLVIAIDLSTTSYAKRSPSSFVASILNTIEIMSDNILREELQLADVVLNPRLETQELTFKASAAFIRKGVEVTREVVTDIKRKLYYATVAER